MSLKQVSSTLGLVQGPSGEETLACQFLHMTNAQGCVWYGGNPLSYTLPVVLLQLIAIFFITNAIWFLLKPFKQGLISAQLIGGIIMGQSFLGNIKSYNETLFPPGGRLVLHTFADIGFMLYLFLLGVNVDISLVKKVKRNAVVIGVVSYLLPLTVGAAAVFTIPHLFEVDASVKQSMLFAACMNAMSAFPVITSLLNDLNILNSEIGRMATLASFASDVCSYSISAFFGSLLLWMNTMRWHDIVNIVSAAAYLCMIIFVLRPVIILISKRVREGQQMKEIHFIAIMVIVLICGLCSEVFGQPAGLGTFLLGVVVPEGLPLASSLITKLTTITTGLLVPAKFVISGLNMDLFSIRASSGAIIALVLFLSYSTKFTIALVSALYFKIPLKDAVSLALIMCCRGVIEATLYITLYEDGLINSEAYAILLISMLIVTGIARLLISRLYDPSARYYGQRKNSILSNHPNEEFRIVVCVHNVDNVPTIIDLLDASTPLRNQPIAVSVLHLMELKGRAASVLELNTKQGKGKLSSSRTWSKQVANAFELFTKRNQGSVIVRHFTSISPYVSMHDDVCMLGHDQNANIIIIPFHKQWSIDGGVGTNSPAIRTVNQNVIMKSPCSVGILIDRGQITGRTSVMTSPSMFNITILFFGGSDDCEALAYASRFIDNPHINLTFIWIKRLDHKSYGEQVEDELNVEMVKQFRAKSIGNERIRYREELVKDSIGTTRVIGSMEDGYCDLCIVGRYHDPDSPLVFGLTDWSECPELGAIGDMLSTSNFKFSVLVVQQQPPNDLLDSQCLQPMSSIASFR